MGSDVSSRSTSVTWSVVADGVGDDDDEIDSVIEDEVKGDAPVKAEEVNFGQVINKATSEVKKMAKDEEEFFLVAT